METNITKINVGGNLLPVNDPNVCDNYEDGNTASKTYNAGKFLVWKGTLYKTTTTIAQGATFTDGVNLEETTIAELLESVNDALNWKSIVLSHDENNPVFSTTEQTYQNDLLKGAREVVVIPLTGGVPQTRGRILITPLDITESNYTFTEPQNGNYAHLQCSNLNSEAGSFKYKTSSTNWGGSINIWQILYR